MKRRKSKIVKRKKPVEKLSWDDVKEDQPELDKIMKRRLELQKKAESSKKSDLIKNDGLEVNFWVCLTFRSWKQREEFMNSPQIRSVPNYMGVYVDGQAMAEKLGIKLTKDELPPYDSPLNRKLTERVIKGHR